MGCTGEKYSVLQRSWGSLPNNLESNEASFLTIILVIFVLMTIALSLAVQACVGK